jgi:hypothetical protein
MVFLLTGMRLFRESVTIVSRSVIRYSAGCQVFQRSEDFTAFILLAKQHNQRYGNSLTYTLVDLRAVSRFTLKRVVQNITILAILGLVAAIKVSAK